MNKLEMLQTMGLVVYYTAIVTAGISIIMAVQLPHNYKAWALLPWFAFVGLLGNPEIQLNVIEFFGGMLK